MDNRKYLPLLIIGASLLVLFSISNSIFFTIQATERAVIFRNLVEVWTRRISSNLTST